eukprot:COSAG01_NODE_1585_length_9810_cov_8.980435_8_plen_63_part_00
MQSISAQVCGSEREGLLQGSLLLQMHCGAAAAVRPDHLEFAAAVKSAAVKSAAATDFTGPTE